MQHADSSGNGNVSMKNEPVSLEEQIAMLEASGDYRVLRRLRATPHYHAPGSEPVTLALALDVETTGLSTTTDCIIQLALVPFTYGRETGTIYQVRSPLVFFEDPGFPLPDEITRLTGITDADVAGQRIDDDAVATLLKAAGLVIAHNAAFDRPFAEKRLAKFEKKPWGYEYVSLSYLCFRHAGVFFDAHRADADCYALIHLLATPFPDGTLPMQALLARARTPYAGLWAAETRIGANELLKQRGYHWRPATAKRPKAWYKELPATDIEAEKAWLSTNIYQGTSPNLLIDALDERRRFSASER
jgi:DNA polymerase-3 subunit epsilon